MAELACYYDNQKNLVIEIKNYFFIEPANSDIFNFSGVPAKTLFEKVQKFVKSTMTSEFQAKEQKGFSPNYQIIISNPKNLSSFYLNLINYQKNLRFGS